jgi:HTH-type transcriptional regulator / antitoxin HipB
MNYPVNTSMQLSAILRGMRKSKSLSQLQAGQLLGVNQKRVARIERNPGVTSFDQITRLVSALGGRILVEMTENNPSPTPKERPVARNQEKRISKAPSKPATGRKESTSDA